MSTTTIQSGDPPINPAVLAPTESGPLLLRLPVPEFLSRCLKSPGVSPEQAQAFQTKFWKLHVDSQRGSSGAAGASADHPVEEPAAAAAAPRQALLDSSADPDPDAASIPFQQRIRPGSVFRWKAPREYASFAAGGKSLAMVLCPTHAVNASVRDAMGVQVNPGGCVEPEGRGEEAYLCAVVTPSLLPGSYEVSLWRQVVVTLEQMEAEVILEWDSASRYYYMTV